MWLIRVMFLWGEFLRWSLDCNIQSTVATASSSPKDIVVCSWFNLCGLVLLVRILFEHSYVYLSHFSELICFHIKCSARYSTNCYTTTMSAQEGTSPWSPKHIISIIYPILPILQKGRTTVEWAGNLITMQIIKICLLQSFLENSVPDHSHQHLPQKFTKWTDRNKRTFTIRLKRLKSLGSPILRGPKFWE